MAKFKSIVALLGFTRLALSIPADPNATNSSAGTLIDCLNASNVPLIAPSDADYAWAVIPFNLRLPFFPVAVAVPTTAAHVSSAVKCAQKFGTKVAARSGGHSYAAYSLGGANGSLMIDLKKFRELSVDPNTFVATVGPGLRLGDVASGIYEIAGRGLPHGTCAGVGISGHALHGGFGYAARMWGTTLDNIVEVEVVLANGDIVIASEQTNSDLFWALRGAGSSFGIVTTFKFKTYPAPKSAVSFTWAWTLDNTATDTVEKKVKVFQAMQDYGIALAPHNLALRIFTMPMTGYFEIGGAYYGSLEDFNKTIAPLVADFPQDGIPTPKLVEYGYIGLVEVLALGQPLHQPLNYTMHDTFFTKSIVSPEKLTSKALNSFFTFHSENAEKPPLEWWVIADLYGGESSQISSQNPAATSYGVRDSLFTFQLYSYVDAASDPSITYPPWGIEFMDELSRSLTEAQPETKFHAYPNYVDPSLSPQKAHELYYSDNYPKLKKLKELYDPNLLFWNPQAIGTS